MIIFTLILAGVTTTHNVDAVTFNYPAFQAQATYTDAAGLHTCSGHLGFTYDGATPVTASITADKCIEDRIFNNGFN